MAKQAICYCRFSPRPDAAECDSCEKQEERCQAFCQRRGYQVARVIADPDVSGGLLSRPGLSAALEALQPGWVLVVDRSDRLARDMLVSLTIRHQVAQIGATIEYADGSPDDTTPEGELMQNILAAFAAYERACIRRATARGLARKRAAGQWVGRPPVGWRMDPDGSGTLVRNMEEQAAIICARELRERGLRSKEIADALNVDFGGYRGHPWSARTIRKMLANGIH